MSYYRRPYYYRRRRNRNYNYSSDSVISLLATFAFLIVIGSVSISFLNFLWPVLIFFGFWAFIIWFGLRLFRRDKFLRGSITTDPIGVSDIEKIKQINTEKHGCKCYMEGLNGGEQEVADRLSEGLSYKDYFIFNNIIIPSNLNVSSQIDHIVVSKFGIFVIETKNYKGWIFGKKDDENWTQSLPGRAKFVFQNPLRQNYSHIKSLNMLIPFVPENHFKSVVVFTESSQFKTESIENIVSVKNVINYIKNFNQNILSETDLQLVLGKLSYMCQTADITIEQHVSNTKAAHGQVE